MHNIRRMFAKITVSLNFKSKTISLYTSNPQLSPSTSFLSVYVLPLLN